jgi:hypothetical protein
VDLTISAALIGRGLMQAPLAVFVFDTALRIVWTNGAVPAVDAASIERSLRHVLRTGETADIDKRVGVHAGRYGTTYLVSGAWTSPASSFWGSGKRRGESLR